MVVEKTSRRRISTLAHMPFYLACVLGLLLFSEQGLSFTTHAQTSSSQQSSAGSTTALTPLQLEIEKQRRRLASSETEERRDAVMRLGWMKRPESSRVAASALTDSAAIVRATATRAVLSLPLDEGALALLPLLADRDEFVRREAAYAVGETRSRQAVEPLIDLLAQDKEPGVRAAAAVALGMIGDERAVVPLAATLERRVAGQGLIKKITRARTEENEFVRRASARALGQIGSRAGVPALISALSNEKAGDDVRREAAGALGLIADPSATGALRAVLTSRDPYLSRLAYEALLKIAPTEAARPM